MKEHNIFNPIKLNYIYVLNAFFS